MKQKKYLYAPLGFLLIVWCISAGQPTVAAEPGHPLGKMDRFGDEHRIKPIKRRKSHRRMTTGRYSSDGTGWGKLKLPGQKNTRAGASIQRTTSEILKDIS